MGRRDKTKKAKKAPSSPAGASDVDAAVERGLAELRGHVSAALTRAHSLVGNSKTSNNGVVCSGAGDALTSVLAAIQAAQGGADSGEGPTHDAMRVAAASASFAEGKHGDAERVWSALADDKAASAAARGRALCNMGAAELARGDTAQAETTLERALELCEAEDNWAVEACVRGNLARLHMQRRDWTAAVPHLQRQRYLARWLRNDTLLGVALRHASQVALALGFARAAAVNALAALRLACEGDDASAAVACAGMLGAATATLGAHKEADALLALHAEHAPQGSDAVHAHTLRGVHTSDRKQSASAFSAATRAAGDDAVLRIGLLLAQAETLLEAGRVGDAADCADEAEELAANAKDAWSVAEAERVGGLVDLADGEQDDACARLRKSIKLLQRGGWSTLAARAGYARALLDSGDTEKAGDVLDAAAEAAETAGDAAAEAELNLLEAEMEADEPAEAAACAADALQLFERAGDVQGVASCVRKLLESGKPSADERAQLLTRVEYAARPLRVWCGSFNLPECPPPESERLQHWLPTDGPHDVLAFAFQECIYEPTHGDTVREDITHRMSTHLRDHYTLVSLHSHHSVYTFVFVRHALAPLVASVVVGSSAPPHKSSVPKAGVGVSFQLLGRRYCFVGEHGPAHTHQNDDRLHFYNEITRDVVRQGGKIDEDTIDCVFWFGDLNFRCEIDYWEGVRCAKSRRFGPLFKVCQLRRAQRECTAYMGYEEGHIAFRPTFKLAMPPAHDSKFGCREYDEKKMREPSFVDRVLYRIGGHACAVLCTAYDAVTALDDSDHIPVYSSLLVA